MSSTAAVAHSQSAPTRRIYAWAVGRITISFTSTSAGCSIANAIARAIASGAIANLSRDAASWAFTSGFVTPSVKFVRTKPGEMLVTQVVEGRDWHDAGIVDENVKLAVPLTCQLHEVG